MTGAGHPVADKLLGLLGGSLCCAWVPVGPPGSAPAGGPAEPARADDDRTEPIQGTDDAAPPAWPAGTEPPAQRPAESRRAAPDAVPEAAEPAPAELAPNGPETAASPTEGRAIGGGGPRPWPPTLLLVPFLLATAVAGPVPPLWPAAARVPTVNSAVPTMHAATVDMSALSFDGVVEVPTLRGPLRTLKFSMGRVVMHDYSLDAPAGSDGGAVALAIDTLTLTSNVDFYTTMMSGLLFGTVPVTFTPDSPPPLVLPTTTFTNFTSAQVFVSSGSLKARGLE